MFWRVRKSVGRTFQIKIRKLCAMRGTWCNQKIKIKMRGVHVEYVAHVWTFR